MNFSKDSSLKIITLTYILVFLFSFLQYYLFLIANVRKIPNMTFTRITPAVLFISSIMGSSTLVYCHAHAYSSSILFPPNPNPNPNPNPQGSFKSTFSGRPALLLRRSSCPCVSPSTDAQEASCSQFHCKANAADLSSSFPHPH
jgi:hypothetical protein